MRVGDVCIDLGGRNIGVAEHGLDGAKIGAVHEEVSSKGMSKSVRGNMFSDAGKASVFLDDALDATGSHAAVIAGSVNGLGVAAIVQKESREGIGAGIEIILHTFCGGFTDENRAVFTTFTSDHKFTTFEIDGIAV